MAGAAMVVVHLAGIATSAAFTAPRLRGTGSAAAVSLAAEPSRRDMAVTGPAGLAALWVLTMGQEVAIAAVGRAEVQAGADALRDVQARWGEFEKAGEPGVAAAGEALTAVLGSTAERRVEITVPPGDSIGVDIEGRAVTSVSKKGLGWQQGDFLEQINGVDLKDEEDVVKKVKQAKEGGGPIKIAVSRRFQTPFVTINKSLRLIYEDTNAPIAEQEEVMARIGSLKIKSGLLADGIGELPDIKKRLDTLVSDLDAYVAAPSVADAPAPQKTPKQDSGADMSELFGN